MKEFKELVTFWGTIKITGLLLFIGFFINYQVSQKWAGYYIEDGVETVVSTYDHRQSCSTEMTKLRKKNWGCRRIDKAVKLLEKGAKYLP